MPERLQQCFSTFLLQRKLPQMFALLTEPYAMIQVSILLQQHRTVVANFVPGEFGLFRRNPWQPLEEPRLKNTGLQHETVNRSCWPVLTFSCSEEQQTNLSETQKKMWKISESVTIDVCCNSSANEKRKHFSTVHKTFSTVKHSNMPDLLMAISGVGPCFFSLKHFDHF